MGMIDRIEELKKDQLQSEEKLYEVLIPIAGFVSVEVFASSEKAAVERAWKVINIGREGTTQMEWDYKGEPTASLMEVSK